jgi:hypothetical protein
MPCKYLGAFLFLIFTRICLAVGSGDVLNFSFDLLYTLLIAEFIVACLVFGAALALKSSMIGASPLLGISATITHVYAPYFYVTIDFNIGTRCAFDQGRVEWGGVEGGGWSRLKKFF